MGAPGYERASRVLGGYWLDLQHTGTLPGFVHHRDHCNILQRVWFSYQRSYETLKVQYFETLKHVELVATNGWGTGAKDAFEKIQRLKDYIIKLFGQDFFATEPLRTDAAKIVALKLEHQSHVWGAVTSLLFGKSYRDCSKKQKRVAVHAETEANGDLRGALKIAKTYLSEGKHLDVENLRDELLAVSLYGESWRVRAHYAMSGQLTPTGGSLSELIKDENAGSDPA